MIWKSCFKAQIPFHLPVFSILARKKRKEGVCSRSKHICGFSDHIKDILPQKRPPPFPALAKSLVLKRNTNGSGCLTWLCQFLPVLSSPSALPDPWGRPTRTPWSPSYKNTTVLCHFCAPSRDMRSAAAGNKEGGRERNGKKEKGVSG